MVCAAIAWGVIAVVGEGVGAAPPTTAELEAYFVGHWQHDVREEDDLAEIDGELWGRVNRDREGPPVAPSDEELAAYREERVKPMAKSSARHAELEHHVYEAGGRLLRFRRLDSARQEGKVTYGTYKVEREESGGFALVLQMDGQKATRQMLYPYTIQDAFGQGTHLWNTGSQYRMIDSDHYQHAVVRDNMPQVFHVQTYARVAAPPDWVAKVLAREAKAKKQMVVRIDQGVLTVNDTELSFPRTLDTLSDVLGKPDRKRITEFNTIFLWDEAGICAYRKPGDLFIDEIVLFFDVASLDKKIWPMKAFAGELIIDKMPVNSRMSLEEVNKDRAKPFEPRPNFKKWKQIEYDEMTVTLESTSEESQKDGQHFGRVMLDFED